MSKSFNTALIAEIARISKREKLSQDKAFLFWFAATILELTDDEAREAISVEGANDKGIDLFYIDDDEGRIVIAQGKFSNALTFKPKISHITKLQSSLDWLTNPEALKRDGKPDLAQAATDYLSAIRDGYGVELWFIYTGAKCPNIDKHIHVYNQNPENVTNRRGVRHYHTDIIEAIWQELNGSSIRIKHETISIAKGEPHSFEGRFGNASVVSVPATEIVRLYNKYDDRLFDRNVRLFLGVRKGSVNAGIAETLRNSKESKNFWAYNNGLTIVCDTHSINKNKDKVTVDNFSIVNGCQTAVSLSQGSADRLDDVSVLVRFISASSEIVDDIIRYNNSQNPIRTWDIASQDRTQRRLKVAFTQLTHPYIYMTRRGARPKGDMRKYRYDGRLHQIRIDIMGQYAAAFRDNPVLAYKHKAFIFSKYHDDVFHSDVRVEEVLFQWICGEITRSVVQSAIVQKDESEVRILKKGGTLFVLSIMSLILCKRNGATYLSNCSENAISSKGMATRLIKYSEYARNAYIQAVLDQPELDKTELATLIRQPEFYCRVRDRIIRQYEKDARATRWLNEALPPIKLKEV